MIPNSYRVPLTCRFCKYSSVLSPYLDTNERWFCRFGLDKSSLNRVNGWRVSPEGTCDEFLKEDEDE